MMTRREKWIPPSWWINGIILSVIISLCISIVSQHFDPWPLELASYIFTVMVMWFAWPFLVYLFIFVAFLDKILNNWRQNNNG